MLGRRRKAKAAPLCVHEGDDPIDMETYNMGDGFVMTVSVCLSCGFSTLQNREDYTLIGTERSTWGEWEA